MHMCSSCCEIIAKHGVVCDSGSQRLTMAMSDKKICALVLHFLSIAA